MVWRPMESIFPQVMTMWGKKIIPKANEIQIKNLGLPRIF